MRQPSHLVIASTAWLIAACATANVARLPDYVERPPLSPDQVTVYFDFEELPADYERVAIVQVHRIDWTTPNTEEALQRLREEAAKLGANAVVVDDLPRQDLEAATRRRERRRHLRESERPTLNRRKAWP